MNSEVGRASCELAGLRLDADGARLFGGAVRDHVAALLGAIATLSIGAAGIRIHRVAALDAHITSTGVIGAVAASLLGPASRPVRAILFDKSAAANWALGWHQDRTIAVAARADVPGFTRWTIKGGLLHVSPPATILEAMITLRVHLEDVRQITRRC